LAKKVREPIDSVELTISIKTDRATGDKIRAVVPSARFRNGACDVKLVGERPADVALRAEETMEKLRELLVSPKDFKNAEESAKKK